MSEAAQNGIHSDNDLRRLARQVAKVTDAPQGGFAKWAREHDPAPSPVVRKTNGTDDSAAPVSGSDIIQKETVMENEDKNVSGIMGRLRGNGITDEQALTHFMNERAGGEFISVDKVRHALQHPKWTFSDAGMTIRIINYRILQTVNEQHKKTGLGKEYTAEEFWNIRQEKTYNPILQIAREAYERFLRQLDDKNNHHIQNIEQLAKIAGINKGDILHLFGRIYHAYPRTERDKPRNFRPGKTLGRLAEVLKCTPSAIIHGRTWRRALVIWESQPKTPAPPRKRPVADQKGNGTLATEQATEPVTVPLPTGSGNGEIPHVPEEETTIGDYLADLRAVAFEMVATFEQKLRGAEKTLLHRVERLEPFVEAEPLDKVAGELRMTVTAAGGYLAAAKQKVAGPVRAAKLEVTDRQTVEALRGYFHDPDHAVLQRHIEGDDDKTIGDSFVPPMSEHEVQKTRDRILGNISAILQNGSKATIG